MKPIRLLPLAVIAVVAVVASAARLPETRGTRSEDPTFVDVAPIFYRNCASCHRPGGLGPFSLLDYDSAAPKLRKMKAMVSSGRMPPWQATGPRGVFRNDRRLTDQERDLIVRWLDSGAKPGDLKQQPPRPHYAAGWEIGTPDAIVTMPDDYVVPASGTIEYQYFEVPTGITEEKWVQAIEIMPGAREVVHHVLVYAKVPAPPPPATPPAARTPSRQTHRAGTRRILHRGSSARSSAAPRPGRMSWSSRRAPHCACAPGPCSPSRCTTPRTATR
jgi:mono/diheme cytochrome c family protein